MTVQPAQAQSKTIAIVGGGFAGSLFALKVTAARPDFRVVLIERGARHGRGLAYGPCDAYHLLNVPVPRMELGLKPGFAEWLRENSRAFWTRRWPRRAAKPPPPSSRGGVSAIIWKSASRNRPPSRGCAAMRCGR